jgi:hypothetical protein
MKTLDQGRDFGFIYGMPGVAYHQDGTYFDSKGHEVAVEAVTDPAVLTQDLREELERMHWTKLRARLSVLGVEYTTKEEAIEALLK